MSRLTGWHLAVVVALMSVACGSDSPTAPTNVVDPDPDPQVRTQSSVTHIYDLNGSLTDTMGGPALVAAGGTLNATGYSFGPNQGLSLSNGFLDPADYSIELLFNFTTLSAPESQKIVDFRNRIGDTGFYTFNASLTFCCPSNVGANNLSSGVDAHVVITRDGGTHQSEAYLNGVLQFSILEGSGRGIVLGNLVHFFIDDEDHLPLEAGPGAVDYIRLYHGPLTGPQVVSLYQGGTPPGL